MIHEPYVEYATIAGQRVNFYIVCFVEHFIHGTQQKTKITQGKYCLNWVLNFLLDTNFELSYIRIVSLCLTVQWCVKASLFLTLNQPNNDEH